MLLPDGGLEAFTINNNGQIVGHGRIGGNIDSFLLTSPVPEAKTYAMLSVGFGWLGFTAYRRKRLING